MIPQESKKALIASRLCLARKQAGLTQGQLAELVNLSRPSISEAEAGRRNISATELTQFADICGVSVQWLSGENAEYPDTARDRLTLAARELANLKSEDLDKVINLLSALKGN